MTREQAGRDTAHAFGAAFGAGLALWTPKAAVAYALLAALYACVSWARA